MTDRRIGDVARLTGLSVDTLRYYEKEQLLTNIRRSTSGIRLYSERDISRLRFIQRAQKMGFRLKEIHQLLQMRDDPQQVKDDIRLLTHHKLQEVEERIKELDHLRRELQLLLNLCQQSEAGCPIIEGIDNDD